MSTRKQRSKNKFEKVEVTPTIIKPLTTFEQHLKKLGYKPSNFIYKCKTADNLTFIQKHTGNRLDIRF